MKISLPTSCFVAALLISGPVHAAFEQCSQDFPAQTAPALDPKFAGQLRVHDLCFTAFAVLYSELTHSPIYSEERLNKVRIDSARQEGRTEDFHEEPRLPQGVRARLSDFVGSGYDRGHMAPSGDMPTVGTVSESFSLSNMVPQAPEHNRGLWAKVEGDTRRYVERAKGDVYVFTGPWYTQTLPEAIGSDRVWVPDIIWKVVYDPSANRAWPSGRPTTTRSGCRSRSATTSSCRRRAVC